MSSAEIKLNRGYVAIIDRDDLETLTRYNWNVTKQRNCYYALTATEDLRILMMHRFILDPPRHLVVDHINGNGLDNRRCNIRLATIAQNAWNRPANLRNGKSTSPYKGVWYESDGKRKKRWRARIRVHGKAHNLGTFATDIEAAIAYDEAAKTHFKEFARLNFDN